MKQNVEEKYESQKAEVRDVVSKEVEQDESWISRAWSSFKSWFSG